MGNYDFCAGQKMGITSIATVVEGRELFQTLLQWDVCQGGERRKMWAVYVSWMCVFNVDVGEILSSVLVHFLVLITQYH